MALYLLTTKFPPGVLKSPELLNVASGVRNAYGTISFSFVGSYVVSDDTTLDIVEAADKEAAEAAARAIEGVTGTQITVAEITQWNSHMQTMRNRAQAY